jgi:hypothetical protein
VQNWHKFQMMLNRLFNDVKSDRKQAVQATLLSNASLANAVHPTVCSATDIESVWRFTWEAYLDLSSCLVHGVRLVSGHGVAFGALGSSQGRHGL